MYFLDIEKKARGGHIIAEIFPELKGRKVDEVVKSYLSAVKTGAPIEVVKNGCTLQARQHGHVMICLNEDDTIKHIEIHLQVSLPDGVKNGGDLMRLVKSNG